MRKIIKFLVITSFAITFLNADRHTNKTFLQPRSQGVNLAMEYTTWNEFLTNKNKDRLGSYFQIVPFAQQSTHHTRTGKNFGINGKNNFIIGNMNYDGVDLDSRFIIHDFRTSELSYDSSAKIELNPKIKSYGLRIDYYQDLEKLLKGTYIKVVLPIVYESNNIRFNVCYDHPEQGSILNEENIYKYFKGNYSVQTGKDNSQKALKKAQMHGSDSRTSLADIDFVLGYKGFEGEKYHVYFNLGLTIPTGNSSEANNVFEAMVGNGKCWGFGPGFDAALTLWQKADQNIKLIAALNYRYLFEHDQTRTLGLKEYNWGQYMLVARVDGTQALPAANLLTRKVSVKTGSQLDSIASLIYNNGGFSFELGYNLFWKDRENVSLKKHHEKEWFNSTMYNEDWFENNYWVDGNYAFVHPMVSLADYPFRADQKIWSDGAYDSDPVDFVHATKISKSLIDERAAQTSSQVTHKIYGGLGYILACWEYPMFVGIGVGYEFADRAGIERWESWGKIGITF